MLQGKKENEAIHLQSHCLKGNSKSGIEREVKKGNEAMRLQSHCLKGNSKSGIEREVKTGNEAMLLQSHVLKGNSKSEIERDTAAESVDLLRLRLSSRVGCCTVNARRETS